MNSRILTELSRQPFRRLAATVFSIALVLRLGFVLCQPIDPKSSDSQDYESLARNIAQGRGYSLDGSTPDASRAPLYPFFLSLFMRNFTNYIPPVLAAQAVIDALTSVWILGLSISLMNAPAAFLCSLIYALHPVYIGFCGYLLTETLFFNLWFAFMALLTRTWRQDRPLSLAGAGIILATAVLCRPAHLFYPIALAPVFLVAGGDYRRGIRLWLFFFVSFTATLLPWTTRNLIRFGRPIPVISGGGHSWWIGSVVRYPTLEDSLAARPTGDFNSPEGDLFFTRLAAKNWRENRWVLLAQFPRRLMKLWVTSHSGVLQIDRPNSEYLKNGRWLSLAVKSLMLALQVGILFSGAWGAWRLRARWREVLILVMPALYASLHVTNDWGVPRYHLSALPLLWVLGVWAWADGKKSEPANPLP